MDALVLAIQESRKFIDKSRTKQRERPKGCSIILRLHYHNVCDSVGVLYMHQRGAFVVARFDSKDINVLRARNG